MKKQNKQDWGREFVEEATAIIRNFVENGNYNKVTEWLELEKYLQKQLTKAREEAVKEYITWITKGLQVEESDSNWWSYKEYLKSLKDKK